MKWCKKVGTAPYIALNMNTGQHICPPLSQHERSLTCLQAPSMKVRLCYSAIGISRSY